ncbi:hypothetical protein G5714_001232 [Onychostoma macrolepis]|uniref:Uncharacterized protein n=1 Tax=Onychostoma macrolepis TaxID=369639 RepID=A0A7J6DJ99_9TELE|nr:hypothetical protein G5714_001232 [Onychostoma macrolepis]
MKESSSERKRLALLINNVEFKSGDNAEKDELSMERLLKGLGCTALTLRDLTAQGMSAAQREELFQSDSFMVLIRVGAIKTDVWMFRTACQRKSTLRKTSAEVLHSRNPQIGSVFIQDLVEVFNKHAHEDHVEELFRKVLGLFKENHPHPMPCTDRVTLSKKFYLFPGL